MKTRVLSFIFTLCFVVPCVFLFSACGENPTTAQEIVAEVNNQQFSVINGKLYFDYGEPINFSTADFTVSVLYSDGTRQSVDTSQIGADAYTIEWNHGANEILADGTYNLRIVYQNFGFNFDVVVVKKVSTVPIFATETIIYNGQKQKPTIQNLGDINWQLIDIDGAESYDEYGNVNAGSYTLTLSIKDKQKTSWADGTTDDVTLNWQIEPKKVAIPAINFDKATFNEQTLNYEVPYAFDAETYVGVEQSFPFLNINSEEITISGGNATLVGNYNLTLSLNNQNGINNFVWAGQTGEDMLTPRYISWAIVPYTFSLPEFENGLTYSGTPFTFDELIDDAGLTNYYSIMQIGNMTNGVFDDVFMPTDNTLIEFLLPEDNLNFKWENNDIETRTVSVPLIIQKISIDVSGVTIITTGSNGSLTPVAGEANAYTTSYTGATVDQMFAVSIPNEISSLVSYNSSKNKYISADDLQGLPLIFIRDVGAYMVYVGFDLDESIYQITNSVGFTLQITKGQKVAGVDFAIPTFTTMLSHEFSSEPTLADIGFGAIADAELYHWKNADIQIALGQHDYAVVYTPADTQNWASVEFDVSIKYLCDIDFTILDSRYTGEQITLDISNYLTSQIELVSDVQTLTQTEIDSYNIVFAIKDEFKQTYCWADTTNGNKTFVWKIVKGVTVVPEFDNEIYHYVSNAQSANVTLADVSLSGLVDSGSLTWADSTQSVALVSAQNEPYLAIYTPQDSTHYETKDVSIYVYLYVEVPLVTLASESSTYDETQKTTEFSVYDTSLISFNQADSAGLTNQNAGEYDYYFALTQDYMVWAGSHSSSVLQLTYTINKRSTALPAVTASLDYEIVDDVYVFTYRYDAQYDAISQTLPLVIDDFSQITSGSVTESVVGQYSVTIVLNSTQNQYWSNQAQSVEAITINWQIKKAEAENVATPVVSTVYRAFGVSAALSEINLGEGFSWQSPNTSLSFGARNYVALYTMDAQNIEANEISVPISFYQTIQKPTVLTRQTIYTADAQTISFFTDASLIAVGFNNCMKLVTSTSDATTQTDIGQYTYYIEPRSNYVWADTLDTTPITFIWTITDQPLE